MKQKENNFAFIDSQNLNLSIRSQGWELDFGRFRKYLSDKYNITKAFLCIGYVKGNESMYKNLQNQDYILVFKPTLYLPNGKVKGNVDAELVLHAMLEYDNYDKALIVSNDGDFHCLVEYFVQENKLLKLLIPDKKNYSSLLRKYMKYIKFMNNLKRKLEYKKRGINLRTKP